MQAAIKAGGQFGFLSESEPVVASFTLMASCAQMESSNADEDEFVVTEVKQIMAPKVYQSAVEVSITEKWLAKWRQLISDIDKAQRGAPSHFFINTGRQSLKELCDSVTDKDFGRSLVIIRNLLGDRVQMKRLWWMGTASDFLKVAELRVMDLQESLPAKFE